MHHGKGQNRYTAEQGNGLKQSAANVFKQTITPLIRTSRGYILKIEDLLLKPEH
jgi:hypothetical protein